jgi:hypothetical protein
MSVFLKSMVGKFDLKIVFKRNNLRFVTFELVTSYCGLALKFLSLRYDNL